MTKHNRNNSKDIVVWGNNLTSTVGYPRFTALERKTIYIPDKILPLFVGIILSDANLSKSTNRSEARLQFKQSIKHIEYFYYVFNHLSHYCSRGPYTIKTILHKKEHITIGFTTRTLFCITELYNIFYSNNKKIIPENLYDLLTWESLAHWIMGDGTFNSGLRLQTECFTVKELVFVINILMIKFDLSCTLHKQRKYLIIYIKSKSLKNNLHYLLTYFTKSMVYKIKINFYC